MRRHVEREHAQNQTISVRTNVDPDEFTPVPGDTPLPEIALTTVTPDEAILSKRVTTADSHASSAGPLALSELLLTPDLDPGPISSEPPQISNSPISGSTFHTDPTAAPSSTYDPPIQPLPTASPISKRTQRTTKIGSPLKEVTASALNRSSGSEGRRAPSTGKNTCPHCEERFDHSLIFHRRLKHIQKVGVGSGPHKVEVKRGENGKFTCPLCSSWDNKNPEKLRVSDLLILLELSDNDQQIHLPQCKEKKNIQQLSNDRSNIGRQTRQSHRVAPRRSIHSDNHRASTDGVPQPDQTQLPSECGDVDDEGDSASGREIHTMDVEEEGPLTEEGSHRNGPDVGSGSCGLPTTDVNSDRRQTRTRNPNNDLSNSDDSAAAFDTQVDERDPSPSITFILSKMNLRVISIPSPDQRRLPHRFMVCTTCQMGLDPDNAVHHATSKDQSHFGHGISILLQERTLVQKWIAAASDLHSSQNPPPIPAAQSPPVPGLKVLKGHRCSTCGECKESEEMMKRHSSSTGHKKPRAASVQFFFSTREKKYFVVQPGRGATTIGHTEKDVDMYALYAELFGLDIEEKLPFYHDDKEMPQLLQITRWFDHVWPYLRLRADDVDEDSDHSRDGLSEEKGGTQDEPSSDEDDGYETRAGTKRKRSRPNAHLTAERPPSQKRRKGTTGSDTAAWSGGRMMVNDANYFSSDDDPMANSDEEGHEDDEDYDERGKEDDDDDGGQEDDDDDDGGQEDKDEDEGEGEDYDFVQLKNRRKIDKKEQRRWSEWDTLTSVSKAKTLVSVRQPGSSPEKARWYGTGLRDTISCYAKSIGKEIRSSSSGFEIRRILGR